MSFTATLHYREPTEKQLTLARLLLEEERIKFTEVEVPAVSDFLKLSRGRRITGWVIELQGDMCLDWRQYYAALSKRGLFLV